VIYEIRHHEEQVSADRVLGEAISDELFSSAHVYDCYEQQLSLASGLVHNPILPDFTSHFRFAKLK
jgi:hypothetical protein